MTNPFYFSQKGGALPTGPRGYLSSSPKKWFAFCAAETNNFSRPQGSNSLTMVYRKCLGINSGIFSRAVSLFLCVFVLPTKPLLRAYCWRSIVNTTSWFVSNFIILTHAWLLYTHHSLLKSLITNICLYTTHIFTYTRYYKAYIT